jgi:hypothetical protein
MCLRKPPRDAVAALAIRGMMMDDDGGKIPLSSGTPQKIAKLN